MREDKNKLSASLEDYLEAIYHIINDKNAARPKDISQKLGVNNSSVTDALNALSKKELINYAPYELISLTSKGSSTAKKIVKRHKILNSFFRDILLVNPQDAEEIACKVEHVIPQNLICTFSNLINYIETNEKSLDSWKTKFSEFSEN
jgi:DtxR family Mn-dependent transcriptional regulator